MANTQHRSIRIPDDVWTPAMEVAKQRGTSAGELCREFLEWYLCVPGAELPSRPAEPVPEPLNLDVGETVIAFVGRAIRNELDRERRREARAAREQND